MIDFKDYIENIPNFPKDGILYRDIQPLLKEQRVFKEAIKRMGSMVETPDYWVAVESRGFLFASALSYKFGGGIKLIRKAGKLPNPHLISVDYGLEYGKDTLEISDDNDNGGKVVIVDDVFATGGTIDAAEELCKLAGYDVIGKICLVDIGLTERTDVKSLVYYEKD
jgi:adenine phosphoribosyltransferase